MIGKNWNKMYLLCKEYYEKNNNLLIPGTYTLFIDGEEIKLGKWIIIQRYLKNTNVLDEEKIRLLNDINMVWKLNDLKWMNNYKYVKDYYNAHKNLQMPYCYNILNIDGKIIKLKNWLDDQKKDYKNGKLSDEQMKLLDDIGLVVRTRNNISWDECYMLAKEYYDTYGNLKVPTNYKMTCKNGGIFNLYYWINKQKTSYRKNKLSETRIELLNKIKISWEPKEDKISPKWYKNYHYAKMFYNKWQRLNISIDYTVIDESGNKINLGQWIARQRQHYKNNVLTKKQIDLLNDIGMIWIIKDSSIKNYKKWDKNYSLAKKYYDENNNLLIPHNYKVLDDNNKEISLGSWINAQRMKYKDGKLTEEKIFLLDNIKMIWSLRYDNWDIYYKKLKEYKEMYGDLFIPNNYIFKEENNFYNLYTWLENQKRLLPYLQYKNDAKASKYYNMLNDLGIIWDDINDEILKKYLEDEYNKYINNNLDNYDILKLINSGKLMYKDDYLINKSDVSYFKKMLENRKKDADK